MISLFMPQSVLAAPTVLVLASIANYSNLSTHFLVESCLAPSYTQQSQSSQFLNHFHRPRAPRTGTHAFSTRTTILCRFVLILYTHVWLQVHIWIQAVRSVQIPRPIKLHHLEVHWQSYYFQEHLKYETHIPHLLSISCITKRVSIDFIQAL